MNNRLGDDDAAGLGKGLEYNRSVRILHLVSAALFDAIVCLITLMTYRLQGANLIGDAGARGLGDGLASNATLTELHLVSGIISFVAIKRLWLWLMLMC